MLQGKRIWYLKKIAIPNFQPVGYEEDGHYFIKILLYLFKFLRQIPVPLTTALSGSSAI